MAQQTQVPQVRQMLAMMQDNYGIALSRNGEFAKAIQVQVVPSALSSTVSNQHAQLLLV